MAGIHSVFLQKELAVMRLSDSLYAANIHRARHPNACVFCRGGQIFLAGISRARETLEKRHTPILNQSSPPHEKIEPSCLDLVDRFPSRSHQPKEFPSIPISAITLSTKFWHTNGQFLSDESSLWDFHEETDNTALIRKIGVVYGVDVSHISSANIVEILEAITNQIGQFPEDPILKAIRLDREARDAMLHGLPEQPWNTTSE
jgi:hypothetical protein